MINTDNYYEIIDNIANAAAKSGRTKDDIKLIAVSKTFSLEDVLAVNSLGQNEFGESYVKEFIGKYENNKGDNEINWHYIGQLQSNKVKYIVNKITMLHTLDRISLAEELNKRYSREHSTVDALIEVNIGNEPQKGGVKVDELEAFADKLTEYKNINIKGLMCIHPYNEPEECRKYFAKMKDLSESLKARKYPVHELSMGMSRDYIQAIEEGATIVRVGSAIFGKR